MATFSETFNEVLIASVRDQMAPSNEQLFMTSFVIDRILAPVANAQRAVAEAEAIIDEEPDYVFNLRKQKRAALAEPNLTPEEVLDIQAYFDKKIANMEDKAARAQKRLASNDRVAEGANAAAEKIREHQNRRLQ